MGILTQPGSGACGNQPWGPILLNANSPQAQGLAAWWTPAGVPVLEQRTRQTLIVGGSPSLGVRALPGMALMDFDGTDDILTSPASFQVSMPLTLSVWCLFDVASAAYALIGLRDDSGGQNETYIERSSGDRFRAVSRITGPVFGIATGTTVVATNTLYHVAAVFASATSRTIYVNGRSEATDTASANTTGMETFRLGARNGPGSLLNGCLGDARIYNRALTATEVWNLYNPATRWDLYAQPNRRVYFDVGATFNAALFPWTAHRDLPRAHDTMTPSGRIA
jgi:hypothetical protein